MTLHEGQGSSLACTTVGIPTPTTAFTWTHNGKSTRFIQTEVSIAHHVVINPGFDLVPVLGSLTSTLHLTDVQYLVDRGEYSCNAGIWTHMFDVNIFGKY